MKIALVTAVALVGLSAATAHGSVGRLCVPPRGPGDALVHSRDLRVRGITCVAGRRVALACARFSYGHAGTCVAAGRRWRCSSNHRPLSQSVERCASGWRWMSIRWLD